MKKACVIGHPISHSLSPKLHGYWLKKYGIDGSYTAQKIAPEQLEGGIKQLLQEGFQGFNVTIPHKETILSFLDDIDESAQKIGAVNTVTIREGELVGSNTDAFGFIENLKIHLTNPQSLTPNPFSRPVVLGAGGAARAVVKALIDAGAGTIDIVVRDPEKAKSLAGIADNLNFHAWETLTKTLPSASLLVNTTPIGMSGNTETPIDLTGFSKDAIVTDIVYNPLMTPLLESAKGRGNFIIDGLGMLIFQAIPGFEAWFGKRPKMDLQELHQLKQMLVLP